MFCVLCRSHNTVSPTNGDGTWNSKPCVRNITQAIKLHANSAMHEAAINKEHLQRASPFHKEVQEQETVKNDVLVKVFSTLYWLAKEEIANIKATSLLGLLERLGLEELRHFQHRSIAMAAIIKRDVPDLINIHCVCHRLALACAAASKELNYITKVEGLLLQVWKFYEYSPK